MLTTPLAPLLLCAGGALGAALVSLPHLLRVTTAALHTSSVFQQQHKAKRHTDPLLNRFSPGATPARHSSLAAKELDEM